MTAVLEDGPCGPDRNNENYLRSACFLVCRCCGNKKRVQLEEMLKNELLSKQLMEAAEVHRDDGVGREAEAEDVD